jgi:hypothetical protein
MGLKKRGGSVRKKRRKKNGNIQDQGGGTIV